MIPGVPAYDLDQDVENARFKARTDSFLASLPPGTDPEQATRLAARHTFETALPNDQARDLAAARNPPDPQTIPVPPTAPVAPVLGPPKLEKESESKTSTWGTTKTILGKDEKAIVGQQQAQLGKQAETVRKEGENAAATATAEGIAAEKRARALGEHQKKIENFDAAYKAKMDAFAKEDERLSKVEFTDLVSRASTVKKIGLALSVALGGIGAALQAKGGVKASNGALDIINKAVDDDFALQKANYDKDVRKLAASRGLEQGEYQRGLSMLEIKKANVFERAAEMARAEGAKQKSEAEKLKYERAAQQLDAQGLALKKNVAEAERVQVHAGGSSTTSFTKQDPGMGGKGAGSDRVARENAQTSLTQAEELKKLADLVRTHPEAWKEYQAAVRAQRQADALEKPKLGGMVNLARGTGMGELAVETRLKDNPVAREIHSSIAKLKVAKARELDPVGAINESSMQQATDHLGLMTRSADEIAKTAEGYSAAARAKASANIPGAGAQMPATVAPQQPQVQTFRNPRTGALIRGYRGPDGKIHEVQ